MPRGVSIGELSDLFNTSVAKTYTHHQKSVILDSLPPEYQEDRRRTIAAYVGGLDLTDGRYDSPEFPLFSTIKTLHEGDFYQNCTAGASSESGPRQPWHDIHCRLEGPAARHVLQNFEERWRTVTPNKDTSLPRPGGPGPGGEGCFQCRWRLEGEDTEVHHLGLG